MVNSIEELLKERVVLPDDSVLILIGKLKRIQEELDEELKKE